MKHTAKPKFQPELPPETCPECCGKILSKLCCKRCKGTGKVPNALYCTCKTRGKKTTWNPKCPVHRLTSRKPFKKMTLKEVGDLETQHAPDLGSGQQGRPIRGKFKSGRAQAVDDVEVCPDCRGRCGRYDPNVGNQGTFYPCQTCKGCGSIPSDPPKDSPEIARQPTDKMRRAQIAGRLTDAMCEAQEAFGRAGDGPLIIHACNYLMPILNRHGLAITLIEKTEGKS